MKQLLTIALGVALGIAGYAFMNRYLHAHSATVVVQKNIADTLKAKTVSVSNNTKNNIVLQNKVGSGGQFRDIDTIKSGETKSISFPSKTKHDDVFYKFLVKYDSSFFTVDDIVGDAINFNINLHS